MSASLAVNGGQPVRTDPWPTRPQITPEEMAEYSETILASVRDGKFLNYDGEQEREYCREFGEYVGLPWVDHVSAGTTAIWIALHALDLEPFTEVVVSCLTDPGGMMPIPLLNLVPVVADTAPGSFNTGAEQIEACLTPLTSAILVPHLMGEAADMVGIMQLARERGIPVIEDCSQSHGATLHGQMVGTFGDLSIFSTMAGKHHQSGGQGGLVCCADEETYWKVRRAADRGKPFGLPEGASSPIASLNLNGSDQAALWGRLMLRRLPGLIARRREIAAEVEAATRDLPLTVKPLLPGADSSHWYLMFRFHPERATCDKQTYCEAVTAEGYFLLTSYTWAMPHRKEWFVQRHVFGSSGYPWASPDYKGNRDWEFPCPNVDAADAVLARGDISETWGEPEVAELIAILRKVGEAFGK